MQNVCNANSTGLSPPYCAPQWVLRRFCRPRKVCSTSTTTWRKSPWAELQSLNLIEAQPFLQSWCWIVCFSELVASLHQGVIVSRTSGSRTWPLTQLSLLAWSLSFSSIVQVTQDDLYEDRTFFSSEAWRGGCHAVVHCRSFAPNVGPMKVLLDIQFHHLHVRSNHFDS